jgi:hypothetical protein
MKAFRMIAGACALAGFVAVASHDASAACSRVTAGGEAVTKELATDVAKMNLNFAIASKNAKGKGAVKVTCGAPGPLAWTACKAQQRACT